MAERPVKDYDKFVLRLPEGMREAIAERAKRNGRSMNSEIVQILEDALIKDSIFGGPFKTPLIDDEYEPDKEITLTAAELKEFLHNTAKAIVDDTALMIAKNATDTVVKELLEVYDLVPKDSTKPT